VPVAPTRRRRALAGLAVAAVCLLPGCAGRAPVPTSESSGSSSAAPPTDAASRTAQGQRIEVQVAGDQVTGDTGRVTVAAGTQVTLVITSDVADEAHLHGYDIEKELTPGEPAEMTFDATIPGVFEVELHEAGTVLLTLQVS
jgi:plastocyanin